MSEYIYSPIVKCVRESVTGSIHCQHTVTLGESRKDTPPLEGFTHTSMNKK
jgi:hypothetical protein